MVTASRMSRKKSYNRTMKNNKSTKYVLRKMGQTCHTVHNSSIYFSKIYTFVAKTQRYLSEYLLINVVYAGWKRCAGR